MIEISQMSVSIPLDNATPIYTESQLQSALQAKDQDSNDYSTKKSFAQNHLNITGIMQLISLFLSVFSAGYPLKPAQISLIVLISISLSLQFTIFVLIVILASSKTEQLPGCSKVCTATVVNNLVTSLTGLLMIITTGVTSVSVYARLDGIIPITNATL